MSFFLKEENCDLATLRAVRLCCKKLRSVSDSNKIWNAVPLVLKSGKINLSCLTVLKQKCIGTEGICVEAVCKGTMTHFALKKTRPFHEVCGRAISLAFLVVLMML